MRSWNAPPLRAPSSKPHGVSRWARYPRSHLKSWRLWGRRTQGVPRLPTQNRKIVTVSCSLLAENKGVRLTNRNIVTVLGRSYLPPMRRITEPISSGVARLEPAGPLAGAGLAALDGRELAAFPSVLPQVAAGRPPDSRTRRGGVRWGPAESLPASPEWCSPPPS